MRRTVADVRCKSGANCRRPKASRSAPGEAPILLLAIAWLAFELAIFRDATFAKPGVYVAIMLGVGAVYLLYLLASRGGPKRHGRCLR